MSRRLALTRWRLGRPTCWRGCGRIVWQRCAGRRGLTQREVAVAMGVSVGRVSQIESGDISGIDVLDRYVAALGGLLEIVANFGEEQFRVG